MNFWDEKEAKRLFKELPFYNALIEKVSFKVILSFRFTMN